MIYEFRRVSCEEGRLPALRTLASDHVATLFEKHEIEAVGFFDVVIGPGTANEFPYLLRWSSFDERTEKLNSFRSDPEWMQARAEAEANGPVVLEVNNQLWTPTAYSELQ